MIISFLHFYDFSFLSIVSNFLFGFVVCFCWLEGFSSILQVNGGFFLKRGKKENLFHFFILGRGRVLQPMNTLLLLHYFISSQYLFYFYHFAFPTIAPNFLFGFVVCFCWFEDFSSILQVNGGFLLRFSINIYG